MSNGTKGTGIVIMLLIVFGVAIAGIELGLNHSTDGTFLLVLTFWTMAIQGCIALAAVGELTKGIWLTPLRRELLSVHPLLLLLTVLYLVMWKRIDIYPWAEHPTSWLSDRFFMLRNVVVLFMSFVVSAFLARAVAKGSPNRSTFAVLYVSLFVICQSLVAFDWIMSLEYPWISTLFGGHFFIQSFLMGLLFAVYVIFFRSRAGDTGLTETLRDAGKMIFGFCFLWGGFLFAQYLVIWYGNIPEEVSFIHRRVAPAPYWLLSRIALTLIFAIPFVALLSRKIKTLPLGMALIATSASIGLFIEKIILITPVVPISPLFLTLEFGLMFAVFVLVVLRRDAIMPQIEVETGSSGAT